MSKLSTTIRRRYRSFITRLLRWMKPGIGVKRWMLTLLLGMVLLSFGIALEINEHADSSISQTLLGIPNSFLIRSLFYVVGGIVISWSIRNLYRLLMRPFLKPGVEVYDQISSFQKRDKGPRVVAIGGGTGLSTLLRGLKLYSHNLTAIVTVADDGGSSGLLRENLGILPPGDIRNCLAALSNDEELLTQLFQYRFGARAGVNGHSLGNLLISALSDITGSFEGAVAESGRVLAIRGRVLPSTLHDVRLVAEITEAETNKLVHVFGESQISSVNGDINRLWLEPDNPHAYPPAVQAILNAQLIVIGPGSLYTSLLPNLLVPEIVEAINSSNALKFFVCNVANERGETDGYECLDHIRVIEQYLENIHFDVILCNDDFEAKLPKGVEWVKPDRALKEQYSIYLTGLADREFPWRHDNQKLAEVVMDLLEAKTGPLSNF